MDVDEDEDEDDISVEESCELRAGGGGAERLEEVLLAGSKNEKD